MTRLVTFSQEGSRNYLYLFALQRGSFICILRLQAGWK